jgi:acyl transferase domain-containing protein
MEIPSADGLLVDSPGSGPQGYQDPLQAIAVIGFSMAFPQEATTSDALWELMMKQRSTVTGIPKDRMNIESFYHPDVHRRGQVSLRTL